VERVARDELNLEVEPQDLLGYIEYPSHHQNGLDSPVGLAFRTRRRSSDPAKPPAGCEWFTRPPDGLYAEQREFLVDRLGFSAT
jgi:hypothetical protein